MQKTIDEINEKIKKGKAVVFTADEIIEVAKENGYKKTAKKVDVVTTGTFGPMCSSGAFLNLGHTRPRMRITRAWLNDVEVFCGIAAVDLYIGATQLPDNDPANKVYPGRFEYGGGHLIEDLVAGKKIKIRALSYGTDCYPRKELVGEFTIKDINDAFLFNPRNCYQNYNVAVNLGREKIYTYLGILKPNLGNANYCSAGQLSPLLNDPKYRTIGIGTRIFLCGGIGYIVWHGTQHDPSVTRNKKGIPIGGSGTIAVIGDLKKMKPDWLRGTSIVGYGVSLTVGIGIPIPIFDEEILRYACVTDSDIIAPVVDYSYDYPNLTGRIITEIDYATLKTGKIRIGNKTVPTFPLSSYPKAQKISRILKTWIQTGKFLLTILVQRLPGRESGIKFKPFQGKYK
ncbi:MAG: homocysteine biosynthesis protein [bacterium]